MPTDRDSIFNGGFDSTDVAWTLQTHGSAAATGDVKNGKYELDISAIGTENYQVQVIQHDLHLEKGQWYEVSFEASAGDSRTLEVNVEQHTDPWTSYLTEKQNFEIGKESKTYSFQFQMTASTDKDSRLSFNAGASTGTLTLDNVTLKKIEEPSLKLTTTRFGATVAESTFEVYNLAGKRLGFVEIIENDVQNMQKTVKNAGFGKGLYILRNKTRSFMLPVDR